MPLDALLDKTIPAGVGPGTYIPTGPVAPGGSPVIFFPVYSGPLGVPIEVGILVPSAAGTGALTGTPTVEWSDDPTFATVLHSATIQKPFVETDTYPLKRTVHMTTRATYGRVKIVTNGTNVDFGTIRAWMSPVNTHHNFGGATYD